MRTDERREAEHDEDGEAELRRAVPERPAHDAGHSLGRGRGDSFGAGGHSAVLSFGVSTIVNTSAIRFTIT